jgi:hypothetical protein
LKTGINKYSSTRLEILSKAKALEQAEVAIVESALAKEPKHDQEEGKIPMKAKQHSKIETGNMYTRITSPKTDIITYYFLRHYAQDGDHRYVTTLFGHRLQLLHPITSLHTPFYCFC